MKRKRFCFRNYSTLKCCLFEQINPLTNQVFDLVLDFNLLHFLRLHSLTQHILENRHCHNTQLNSNKIASFSKHKANIFTATNKETDFNPFFFYTLQTENFNSMSSWQIFGNLFADFRFPRRYGHFIRFISQTNTQHSFLQCCSRCVAKFSIFYCLYLN